MHACVHGAQATPWPRWTRSLAMHRLASSNRLDHEHSNGAHAWLKFSCPFALCTEQPRVVTWNSCLSNVGEEFGSGQGNRVKQLSTVQAQGEACEAGM